MHKSSFLNSIPINFNGLKLEQEIAYDWKPSIYLKYFTFSHDNRLFPHNP